MKLCSVSYDLYTTKHITINAWLLSKKKYLANLLLSCEKQKFSTKVALWRCCVRKQRGVVPEMFSLPAWCSSELSSYFSPAFKFSRNNNAFIDWYTTCNNRFIFNSNSRFMIISVYPVISTKLTPWQMYHSRRN